MAADTKTSTAKKAATRQKTVEAKKTLAAKKTSENVKELDAKALDTLGLFIRTYSRF
jgi:hypothetical protein